MIFEMLIIVCFLQFREFYYIQMEKYARQALSEGIKNSEDLHVSVDNELYRVLNLHYNRNNHIEVSVCYIHTIHKDILMSWALIFVVNIDE